MQIGSISSVGPTSSTVEATAAVTPLSSKPTDALETTSASAPVETSSTQSAQAPITVNATQQGSPAAVFSASVSGKDYSADVEKAGGVYFVALDSIPEVTASGTSVLSAENTAADKLDTVV
jgi:hypothetical protein